MNATEQLDRHLGEVSKDVTGMWRLIHSQREELAQYRRTLDVALERVAELEGKVAALEAGQ